jgi:hypothetical protein
LAGERKEDRVAYELLANFYLYGHVVRCLTSGSYTYYGSKRDAHIMHTHYTLRKFSQATGAHVHSVLANSSEAGDVKGNVRQMGSHGC